MNVLRNALLLVASISAAFLATEIAIRFGFKDGIVMFPRYHAAATYGEYQIRRLRPNTEFWHTSVDGRWLHRTNANGYRADHDFAYAKPPGVVRVLVLGDSHTQGYEVAQTATYSAVLERWLRARGLNAEVMNAGVSGFSTAEELVFLENEGFKYAPDYVVAGFYANDFEDNIKANLFALDGDTLVVRSKKHQPGVRILAVINDWALLRWLSENSYAYSVALNTAWEFGKRKLAGERNAALQREFAVAKENPDEYKTSLALRLVERMGESCRKQGAKLILVDIPRIHRDNFVSSIPDGETAKFRSAAHRFVSSHDVLDEWAGTVTFFVPHGHRHISETTHLLLGAAIGRGIATDRATPPPAHR